MSVRVISSSQTWPRWVLGPVLFVASTIAAAGKLYLGWFPAYDRQLFAHGLPPAAVSLFWGIWFLFWLLSLWWTLRLKRVAIDRDWIYVSDFRQSVKLPLSDILGIRENAWIKSHPVTIEFAAATPWGHYVRFMPKIRLLLGWTPNPMVAELRDMVNRAKANQRMTGKLQQEAYTTPPDGKT